MLNSLNDKFINSSLKNKIELYLLPLLLIYLFLYFFQFNDDNNLNNTIQSKNNFNFSKKEFEDSFTNLFSNIESFAIQNQITLLNITNQKKTIHLKAQTDLINIQKFIQKIENLNNFTKIKNLFITKNLTKDYIIEVEIDLNKFYIKKLEKNNLGENIKKIKHNHNFKINGIINNFVFINNKWIEKNEKIDNFKLTKIEKTFVELENNNEKIILEINHEYNNKNTN